MLPQPHTAILLFSRTAREEAAVKTFSHAHGRKVNRRIAEKLIRHSAATARRTGLPVFTAFSPEQSGDSFGERLANAIEDVFREGYRQVIAIGNDCPALTPGRLLRVARQADRRPLVLGPAHDGGVYLIGIRRDAYDRARFLALPWQENTLQQGWTSYARAAGGELHWLPGHSDIDRPEDLRRYLRGPAGGRTLCGELRSLLASVPVPPAPDIPSRLSTEIHRIHALRAPPHGG